MSSKKILTALFLASVFLFVLAGCYGPSSQAILNAFEDKYEINIVPGSAEVLVDPTVTNDHPHIILAQFQEEPKSNTGRECLGLIERERQYGFWSRDDFHVIDFSCPSDSDSSSENSNTSWSLTQIQWKAVNGDFYTLLYGPALHDELHTIQALWQDQVSSMSEVSDSAFLITRSDKADLRMLIGFDKDGHRVDQFNVPTKPDGSSTGF